MAFIIPKPVLKERYFFDSGTMSLPPGTEIQVLAIGGATGAFHVSGSWPGQDGSDTTVSDGTNIITAPGALWQGVGSTYARDKHELQEAFPIGNRGVAGKGYNWDSTWSQRWAWNSYGDGYNAVPVQGQFTMASDTLTVLVGDGGPGGYRDANGIGDYGQPGAVLVRWYEWPMTSGLPIGSSRLVRHEIFDTVALTIPQGVEIYVIGIGAGAGGGAQNASYAKVNGSSGGDTSFSDGTTTITALGGVPLDCVNANKNWSVNSCKDLLLGNRGMGGLGTYGYGPYSYAHPHFMRGGNGHLVSAAFISASTTLNCAIGLGGDRAEIDSTYKAAAGMDGAGIAYWYE